MASREKPYNNRGYGLEPPSDKVNWLVIESQALEWEEVLPSQLHNQFPSSWYCGVCDVILSNNDDKLVGKLYAAKEQGAFGRPLLCGECHRKHIIQGKETP